LAFLKVSGILFSLAFLKLFNSKELIIPEIMLLQEIAEPTRFYHYES